MLAGGSTAAGELALFRRRAGAADWEKLDPANTGYWGGPGEPYRRWFLGSVALLGPRRALAVLYKGYEDGGAVLRTLDGGDSWTTVFTADQDLYAAHFADSRRGWLAGFRGTLWRTEDGCVSWDPQHNPEDITVSCLAFSSGSSFGLAPPVARKGPDDRHGPHLAGRGGTAGVQHAQCGRGRSGVRIRTRSGWPTCPLHQSASPVGEVAATTNSDRAGLWLLTPGMMTKGWWVRCPLAIDLGSGGYFRFTERGGMPPAGCHSEMK
jgi:hypothetical protein